MSNKKLTRRTFIIGVGATLAGTATGEAIAFQRRGGRLVRTAKKTKVVIRSVSPNEKLNYAAIGAGGKGNADINGCKSENVVALCDVDWDRSARMFSEYDKAAKYKDFRVMLEKENIDAVTITTPDHTHAYAAVMAMEMGKHVYVQKPLTYTVAEARLLRRVAKETGVATQMGNQGHSGNGVRKLCEMIWNGDIGQVHECHIWTNRPVWPQGIGRPTEKVAVPSTMDWDLWLGTAPVRPYHPSYAPFNWRGWLDFGCGALGDMACHIADPANWALRLSEVGPISVEAIKNEGMTSETYPNNSVIRYEFPRRGKMDPVTVYWHDGGNRPPLPPGVPAGTKLGDGDNGSLYIGTKGVATAGEYGGKARLLPDELMNDYTFPDETIPRIPGQNPYKDWIRACKDGKPASSNFDYAGPFTEWVVMGNLALKYDEKLEWDAKKMMVTNVAKANYDVTREYRKGWELPI